MADYFPLDEYGTELSGHLVNGTAVAGKGRRTGDEVRDRNGGLNRAYVLVVRNTQLQLGARDEQYLSDVLAQRLDEIRIELCADRGPLASSERILDHHIYRGTWDGGRPIDLDMFDGGEAVGYAIHVLFPQPDRNGRVRVAMQPLDRGTATLRLKPLERMLLDLGRG